MNNNNYKRTKQLVIEGCRNEMQGEKIMDVHYSRLGVINNGILFCLHDNVITISAIYIIDLCEINNTEITQVQ